MFTYFALQYFLRFFICPKKKAFFKEPVNITDGVSINVSILFLILFVSTKNPEMYFFSRIFQSFKIIAFVRLLRLNWRLQTIEASINESGIQLVLSLFYVLLSVLCISTIIFYMEVKENGEQFHSIFATFWQEIYFKIYENLLDIITSLNIHNF